MATAEGLELPMRPSCQDAVDVPQGGIESRLIETAVIVDPATNMVVEHPRRCAYPARGHAAVAPCQEFLRRTLPGRPPREVWALTPPQRTSVTCTAVHAPPRAVLTPRAVSPLATPRRDRTPLARISLMIGRTLDANASAAGDFYNLAALYCCFESGSAFGSVERTIRAKKVSISDKLRGQDDGGRSGSRRLWRPRTSSR